MCERTRQTWQYEHLLEKIDPSLVSAPCIQCDNPAYMPRLQAKLASMEAKMKALEAREQEVKRRGLLGSRVAAPGMPPP